MIRVTALSKRFGRKPALDDVSVELPQGALWGLIGPGASGKTVLIKHVAGLLTPDRGKVEIEGQNISAMGEVSRQRLRSRFGMLFQQNALFDSLTVAENVAFPLRRLTSLGEREIGERVDERLARVGLTDFRDRYPNALSGGQRKRVGIARATVTRSEYVIFDEPTAGLDPVTSQKIFDLLHAEQRAMKSTALMISSDVAGLMTVVDRVGMMLRGKLVFEGTREEALASRDPYVRQFLRGDTEGPL
ncbi:MAG: ATP-binding cassette domain-containing protein [Deltaproteobacteria bacterium]|nr:ATP-binding cassette domain-containing protein [Deltaproteobacteria bacterium]